MTDWQPLPGRSLAEALSACLPSVSRDETRFHLNGVLVQGIDAKVRCVSTDGFRLAIIERPASLVLPDRGVIVPRRAAAAIARIAGDVETIELAHEGHRLLVRAGDASASAKLIDAQFPRYEQTVPRHRDVVTVHRGFLQRAVRRAVQAAGNGASCRLAIAKERLTLSTSSPERDVEVTETIEVLGRTERRHVVLLTRNLADAVRAIDGDRLLVGIGDELEAVTFTGPGGDLALVMPLFDDARDLDTSQPAGTPARRAA